MKKNTIPRRSAKKAKIKKTEQNFYNAFDKNMLGSEVETQNPFKVLIPINNQISSLYALETAMARKWPLNTKFLLLTVIECLDVMAGENKPLHTDTLIAEQDEHRQEMASWLKNVQQYFAEVFPETEANIVFGKIAPKICETAFLWDANYVLIGSHDLSLVNRITLGSVASKVLLNAPCSVEAVRFRNFKDLDSRNTTKECEEIREIAEQAPKRIIVGTDFSDEAENAFDWVAKSPWFDNTEIKLITVKQSIRNAPVASFLAGSKTYISEQKIQQAIENRLRTRAQEISRKLPKCKLETMILHSDCVYEAILEQAHNWEADLVVIGARKSLSTEEEKLVSNAIPLMDRLRCSTIGIKKQNQKLSNFSWYSDLQTTEGRTGI